MKNRCLLLAFSLVFTSGLFAQTKTTKTENIVLITLDGLRWQEVYGGVDSLFVDDTGMIEHAGSLLPDFWHPDPLKRRELLFPFVWGTLAKQGQLFGNRAYGNKVDTQNKLWFSYPGYNELLSGFADDARIRSNDKVNNPNTTFLEHLNQLPEYQNKVMAFGSWDVFPFIVNEERSGIPVNAGFDLAVGENLTAVEKTVNRLQQELRGPWPSVRLDPFTHQYALEAIKNQKPSVLYIAYGETDDWAHDGKYDQYVWSAKQTDAYLKEIWETLQADPKYRNKTTLLITVDHGRGTNKESWKSHGEAIPEAGQVWMMAIGPDTPPLGERKEAGQWYSAMLPRTIFQLLGLEYPDAKAAASVKELIR
jgi:hypothetical protein